MGKYKNELAIDGDLSYLNLDWTPVPIIPKFVDIVVNGMSDRLFSVKAFAQDAMSQAKKSKYQDMIEKNKNFLEAGDEADFINGDIIVHDGQVAFKLNFHISYNLSLLLDRNGKLINVYRSQ